MKWTLPQTGRQPDLRLGDFSDTPVADEIAGESKSLTAALLGSGLKNTIGLLLHFQQMLSLVDCECEGLLAVDIFTRLPRGYGNHDMPVIERAAVHGVDVFSSAPLAK